MGIAISALSIWMLTAVIDITGTVDLLRRANAAEGGR